MRIKILLPAALLLLGACSHEDDSLIDYPNANDGFVSFRSAGITRVTSESEWEEGDKVGIFSSDASVSTNLQYNVDPQTNELSPETDDDKITVSELESVTYTAYYPYSSTLDGSTYKVDITDQSDLTAIDLLWAESTLAGSEEVVDFTFDHKLAKIRFNLYREGKSSLVGAGISGTIESVNTTESFDVVSGTFSGTSENADISMNIVISDSGYSAYVEAILVPTTDLTDVKFSFIMNPDDNSISHYTLDVAALDGGWASGKCYDYGDIYLDETPSTDVVEVATTSITNWTSGGEKEYGTTTPSAAPKAQVGDYYYKDGTWSSVAEYATRIEADPTNYVVGIIYDVDDTGYSGYVISIVGYNMKYGWWYKADGVSKGTGYTGAYSWAEGDYQSITTSATDTYDGLANCIKVQATDSTFDNYLQHKWCWELNGDSTLVYSADSPYDVWYHAAAYEIQAFSEMYVTQYTAALATGSTYAEFSAAFSAMFEDVVDPVVYPDNEEGDGDGYGTEYANRHKILLQNSTSGGTMTYSSSTETASTHCRIWYLDIDGYSTGTLQKNNVGMCTRAVLRFNSPLDVD